MQLLILHRAGYGVVVVAVEGSLDSRKPVAHRTVQKFGRLINLKYRLASRTLNKDCFSQSDGGNCVLVVANENFPSTVAQALLVVL